MIYYSVTALVNAGAHPHVRVNEYESMLTYATPMYFACFYGPHTFCPLVRADIRHYGCSCCFMHPLAYVHNIFVGATYGFLCLCPFQTIPQLTDCGKTWKWCCLPILEFPAELTASCSVSGIKVARIMPDTSEDEKKLEKIKKELSGLDKGGKPNHPIP